ncbi:WD repeat-containing protein slp1 [Entomophthora muscae]|uniref:WD repeat-containing protein slp1 n=1 Tax=Entomophthora muscae TaxID=34485 RepID=A0ACC2U0K4_9FUNG|nr:WD repeat-containing protein slp1 [Entomophthora muscae]
MSTEASSLDFNSSSPSKCGSDEVESTNTLQGSSVRPLNSATAPDFKILNMILKPPEPIKKMTTLASFIKPADSYPNRHIRMEPETVLSAVGFQNDFYSNMLAWSSTNYLALGVFNSELLRTLVYVWDANMGVIHSLVKGGFESRARSLAWSLDGLYLSVGLENGTCQIWDVETFEILRTLKFPSSSPIPALSWAPELFVTGNSDGNIYKHDLREKNHIVGEFESHANGICNLQWRFEGDYLASGGNDDTFKVFDYRVNKPCFKKTIHLSAVKALAWCPWNSHLATGGGKVDKKIHIWNVKDGSRVSSGNAYASVLSLLWAPFHKELVSTHGSPKNSFTIWEVPETSGLLHDPKQGSSTSRVPSDLKEVINVPAHDSRVLESAISPDGLTYCTVASDGCLKFWSPFSGAPSRPAAPLSSSNPPPPSDPRKPFSVLNVSNVKAD